MNINYSFKNAEVNKHNQITDISPLAGLTKLQILWLGYNQITDLSALAGLTELTRLELWANPLSASSINDHIPVLQARGVRVESDPIPYDPTPVTIPDANLRATIAAALGKASGATITKGEMGFLVRLEAPEAGIGFLTGLEFATNLTDLTLDLNQITDISPLAGLTKLTYLALYGNGISDISPLAGLTKLTGLWLHYNNITDISALAGLTNLTSLALSNNNITDISPLAGLTNLTRLRLFNNNITDISPLAGLTKLTSLALGYNQITDISPLAGLTKLQILWLYGNSITDLSALAGLTNLTQLSIQNNKIMGLSALAGLTKLTRLNLYYNQITDISALAGLTNLTRLALDDNQITDISALAGLTNLTWLELLNNQITDISALAGLTNLTWLRLDLNQITDISALAGLTNLTWLRLGFNLIEDVSALRGLTHLTELDLRGNILSISSINDHIPALKRSGTTVLFDSFPEGDFDIELVFLADFTQRQKRVIEYAARRWMSIIREDLPDYTFTQGWSDKCGGQSYEIPSGERIDDLRIYVGSVEKIGDVRIHVANEEVVYEPNALAGPHLSRETFLPILGCVTVNLKSFDSLSSSYLLDMWLHEMGHVLGIGTAIMYESDFLQDSSDDPHFNGPRAIAAFDDAGGRDYTGAKVPVEKSGGHWRSPVLGGELMSSSGISRLSAVTIQALADLGYVVDVTQADPYTLPRAAAKASAKIAAPSAHAQPEFSCGTGQYQEPIYVVDEQGNIIRTLHR